MNLPNKLTVLRVVSIPVFLFFYFFDTIKHHMFIALVLFALASLTDFLDGYIARKRNLVTDFGKLMDPLADKLLVTAAMVCILGYSYQQGSSRVFYVLALIISISRDLIVNSIRLVAASEGIVIAADIFGKLKTIFQMLWVCVAMLKMALLKTEAGMTLDIFVLGANNPPIATAIYIISIMTSVLFYCMLLMTIISGINYIVKNKSVFSDT